ncbi:MAG TPA: FeoB-associated Cys-rich membrane protein [Pirellulales bacterium]
MHFGWQDLLVTLLVAAAAGYLARRAWSLVSSRRAGGCGSACGGCASKSPESSDIVQIEPPKQAK